MRDNGSCLIRIPKIARSAGRKKGNSPGDRVPPNDFFDRFSAHLHTRGRSKTTSFTECFSVIRSMPSTDVALAWRSKSTASTLLPAPGFRQVAVINTLVRSGGITIYRHGKLGSKPIKDHGSLFFVQNLLNSPRQLFYVERLLNKSVATAVHYLCCLAVYAVSA